MSVLVLTQALLHQSPVELLEVRVHALPVRLRIRPYPTQSKSCGPSASFLLSRRDGGQRKETTETVGIYKASEERERNETRQNQKAKIKLRDDSICNCVFIALTFTNTCAKTNNIKKNKLHPFCDLIMQKWQWTNHTYSMEKKYQQCKKWTYQHVTPRLQTNSVVWL